MKKDKEYFPWIWLILIITFVIFCWLLTWKLSYHYLNDLNDRAAFGNMFGSVNTLFSGLAMAGIIVAIFLQKKDLAIQREDLRLQRDELAQTRKEFETQNDTLKKQRFENTFFQLLQFHLALAVSLKNKQASGAISGLLYAYEKRRDDVIGKKKQTDPDFPNYGEITDSSILASIIIESFREALTNIKFEVPNYFLNLYNCFRFIEDSELIRDEEKFFYASIVKAQLSTDERRLLFYYVITPGLGRPAFTFLVKKFQIFSLTELANLHPYYSWIYEDIILHAKDPFKTNHN